MQQLKIQKQNTEKIQWNIHTCEQLAITLWPKWADGAHATSLTQLEWASNFSSSTHVSSLSLKARQKVI